MTSLSTKTTPSSKPRVKFDEAGIAVDYAERGVLYGTQKIDQADTPYIYYDSDEEKTENPSSTMVAQYSTKGEPQRMEAADLQRKLGLLVQQQQQQQQQQQDGADQMNVKEEGSAPTQKWEQAEKRMDFESRRRQLYAQEGRTFTAQQDGSDAEVVVAVVEEGGEENMLPPGWCEMKSRSDGAVFYYHEKNNLTQWETPTL